MCASTEHYLHISPLVRVHSRVPLVQAQSPVSPVSHNPLQQEAGSSTGDWPGVRRWARTLNRPLSWRGRERSSKLTQGADTPQRDALWVVCQSRYVCVSLCVCARVCVCVCESIKAALCFTANLHLLRSEEGKKIDYNWFACFGTCLRNNDWLVRARYYKISDVAWRACLKKWKFVWDSLLQCSLE